jgi:ribulose-phosphate 3-epimerase
LKRGYDIKMKELTVEEYVYEIVPGILEKEWDSIEEKLEQAKKFAKTVHIDLIDGKFASNTTFMDPAPFAKYSKDLILEVHMMVEDPRKYLKPFAEAGFTRFLGHIEKMPSVSDFVAEAQLYGEVGIALDGPTDKSIVDTIPLSDLDCVTVYTCQQVGFTGAQFDERKLDKVRLIKTRSQIPVEVDGGVKDTTILFGKSAGAVRFVATSFIWNAQDPKVAYERLRSIVADH